MVKRRNKPFTVNQDQGICRAYLYISQDPYIGEPQEEERIWDLFVTKYVEITGDHRRTPSSIKDRWSKIQKACNFYNAILWQIQNQHQSGMASQSETDPKQRYKDEADRPFPNLDVCWDILGHFFKPAEIDDMGAFASALANASPEEQRTMLGDHLYPLVEQLEPERVAKVTGMLLEMDQGEVLHLLESPEALKAKVSEAMDVLRFASQNQPSGSTSAPVEMLSRLSLKE